MKRSRSTLLSREEGGAVTKFLDLLCPHFPERVLQARLFGSKARGDSQLCSDIDILLVDDDDWRFQHAISTLAARVSLKYDVLLSPRVIGQQRWEQMEKDRRGLFQRITAEGIPLAPTAAAP
jgi:predicted nucleotidyltransferase